MKKFVMLVAAVAAVAALAVPSAASAYWNTQIPNTLCTVSANTPAHSLGGMQASGNVSCPSNFNLPKRVYVYLYQLVTSGWQIVAQSGWVPSSPTWQNPAGGGVGSSPCVAGRWYATYAYGNAGSNYAGADTFNSGAQC